MIRLLIVFIFGVVFTGCVSQSSTPSIPTGYHVGSKSGGYYEKRISEDQYVILYKGNGYSSFDVIKDYAFLRSAEIGQKIGYKYFVIINISDVSKTESYLHQTPISSTATNESWGGVSVSTTGGETYTQTIWKPRVQLEVKYFSSIPTEKYLELYNVDEIVEKMTEKYNLNGNSKLDEDDIKLNED